MKDWKKEFAKHLKFATSLHGTSTHYELESIIEDAVEQAKQKERERIREISDEFSFKISPTMLNIVKTSEEVTFEIDGEEYLLQTLTKKGN